LSRNHTVTKTGKQTKHGHAHSRTERLQQDDSKRGTAVSGSKSKTFCGGTVHTDRYQCVVLTKLALSATTIFATVGL